MGDINSCYLTVPLAVNKNLWFGELHDAALQRCIAVVLEVEAVGDVAQTIAEVPELTKVASWKRIRSNPRGVRLWASPRPPEGIPYKPNNAYFLLDTEDPHWREILIERRIAVYMRSPYGPPDTRITLMALLVR